MNHPHDDPPQLSKERVLAVLANDGPVSQALKGFEPRQQQLDMLANVVDSYNQSYVALIEAGTGTGKSMAYLIPAVLWAVIHKEPTVISTATIALQEQLLHKDLPLIAKALNVNFKAVLVKGMGNYLCLRKLEETAQEFRMPDDPETKEIEQIQAWSQNTKEGSRASLPMAPSAATWEKVCAEHDTCNKDKCQHYNDCFFYKAREQARNAQILVVNHHLLFSDLNQKMNSEKGTGILPEYKRLVIDEAHNIEDIATEFLAMRISGLGFIQTLARLATEKHNKAYGKLPVLKDMLENILGRQHRQLGPLVNKLTIEVPAARRELVDCVVRLFENLASYTLLFESNQETENKLRIQENQRTKEEWAKILIPHAEKVVESVLHFAHILDAIEIEITGLKSDRLNEASKGVRFEISALKTRLQNTAYQLGNFMKNPNLENSVDWIETRPTKSPTYTQAVSAALDLSQTLYDILFSKYPTIILCSATLSTNKDFTFIRSRLGLSPEIAKHRTVTENIYESPFDYAKQALLIIPNDMPNPSHPQFMQEAIQRILISIEGSRGNAFVLFTSYAALQACYRALAPVLAEKRYRILRQGDANRRQLLEEFKANNRSVLFGTDSFWEGVDVAGEALRLVVIVKLPFKVPSEPIIQARAEVITSKGGSAFMDFSVPQAIVKFKQGFGRLIRNRKDRGCIVCLDSRLSFKGYGKLFLDSLPDCEKLFIPTSQLAETMSAFYKRTHYLTKS